MSTPAAFIIYSCIQIYSTVVNITIINPTKLGFQIYEKLWLNLIRQYENKSRSVPHGNSEDQIRIL